MADFKINAEQHAEKINQGDMVAETINNHGTINLGPQPEDHVRAGNDALARRDYGAARTHFGKAADDSSVTPGIRYRLALALLDGQRPHMASATAIQDIQRQLALAGPLPEARALLTLANEDYHLAWQKSSAVPTELIDLVGSVPLARAREIIEHVPAEQCRVWRLLAARTERGF